MSWFRNLDTLARRFIVIGALACLLIVVGLTLSLCRAKDDAARSEAQTTLGDARTKSAGDASKTRDDVQAKVDTINANVKAGTDAIRNATDPDSRNDAAVRSLCRVDPSSSPECRLLDADPR